MDEVLARGCWTPRESVGAGGDWSADLLAADGSHFAVLHGGEVVGEVRWEQTGRHNVANALAVLAAARHAGVPLSQGLAALGRFQGVKRRLELRGEARGIRVYDDFAHHPTAIATTLEGLRRHLEAGLESGAGVMAEAKARDAGGTMGQTPDEAGAMKGEAVANPDLGQARPAEGRILAVLEPRSNTMRLGVHNASLADSLALADKVYVHAPRDLGWDAAPVFASLGERAVIFDRVEDIVAHLVREGRRGDQVLVMSNGGFQGIHERLLAALAADDRAG